MSYVLCFLCVFGPPGDFTPQRPPALLALEQARLSIRKADVEYSRSEFFSELTHGERFRRREIISGDQIALFHRGTADGTTSWTEEGEPLHRRRAGLRNADQLWEHDLDSIMGLLWEGAKLPAAVKDQIRTAGLVPVNYNAETVAQALWNYPLGDPSPRLYRERVVDGIHEVEMLLSDTGVTYKWYIDPDMGWNVTHCEGIYEGRVIAEAICEYAQYDDVWVPVSTAYLNSVGDLDTLVEVDSIKVNSPDIPDKLLPEIIGLGNGMPIIPARGCRPLPPGEGHLYYAGAGRAVTAEEYRELKRKGEIRNSPEYDEMMREIKARAAAEAQAGGPGELKPTSRPASQPAIIRNKVDDEWERYTREFIGRYQLTEEQSQAAWKILRDCQAQRTRYLSAKRETIRRLEERLQGKKTADEGAEILAQLEELKKPIQRIFEQELKPRLDRLPTRVQRRAAEPATQPAAPRPW